MLSFATLLDVEYIDLSPDSARYACNVIRLSYKVANGASVDEDPCNASDPLIASITLMLDCGFDFNTHNLALLASDALLDIPPQEWPSDLIEREQDIKYLHTLLTKWHHLLDVLILSSGEVRYSGALGWLARYGDWFGEKQGNREAEDDVESVQEDVVQEPSSIPHRKVQVISSRSCIKELRAAFFALFRSMATTYALDPSELQTHSIPVVSKLIEAFVAYLPSPGEITRLPINGHVDLLTPSSWVQIVRDCVEESQKLVMVEGESDRLVLRQCQAAFKRETELQLRGGMFPTLQIRAIQAARGIGMFNYLIKWGALRDQGLYLSGITAREVDSSLIPWPSTKAYHGDELLSTKTLELARVPDRPPSSSFSQLNASVNDWYTSAYLQRQSDQWVSVARGPVLLLDSESMDDALRKAQVISSKLMDLTLWDTDSSNKFRRKTNNGGTYFCSQCAREVVLSGDLSNRPVVVILSSSLSHELLVSGLSLCNPPGNLLEMYQYNTMEANFLDLQSFRRSNLGSERHRKLASLCTALSTKQLDKQLAVLPSAVGFPSRPPHELLAGCGLTWQVLMSYAIDDVSELISALPVNVPLVVIDQRKFDATSNLLDIATDCDLSVTKGDWLLITTANQEKEQLVSNLSTACASDAHNTCSCTPLIQNYDSEVPSSKLHRANVFAHDSPFISHHVLNPEAYDLRPKNKHDLEDKWLADLDHEREHFRILECAREKQFQDKLRAAGDLHQENSQDSGKLVTSSIPYRATEYGAVVDHYHHQYPPSVPDLPWGSAKTSDPIIDINTDEALSKDTMASKKREGLGAMQNELAADAIMEHTAKRLRSDAGPTRDVQSCSTSSTDVTVVTLKIHVKTLNLWKDGSGSSTHYQGMHKNVKEVMMMGSNHKSNSVTEEVPRHGNIMPLQTRRSFDISSTKCAVFGPLWDSINNEIKHEPVARVATEFVSIPQTFGKLSSNEAKRALANMIVQNGKVMRLLCHMTGSFWSDHGRKHRPGIKLQELPFISTEYIKSEIMRITAKRLSHGRHAQQWGPDLLQQAIQKASIGFVTATGGFLIQDNTKVQTKIALAREAIDDEADTEAISRHIRRLNVRARWA